MDIYELKKEAHEKIDELVRMHMNRTQVYQKLLKYLKCPLGQEHFGNMKQGDQVLKALKILDKMVKKRRKKMENPRPPKTPKQEKPTKKERKKKEKSKYASEILPLSQQRDAIRRMKEEQQRREEKEKLWWRKLLVEIKLYAKTILEN